MERQKRNDQVSSNIKYISKIANASSLVCSLVGTSLLAVILVGPENVLEYKRVQIASSCAYGLLIAAAFLGFLGLVLPFYKKHYKQTDPVPSQRDASQKKLFENNRNLKVDSYNISNQLPDNKITLTNWKDKSRRLVSAKDTTSVESTKTSTKSSINTLQNVGLDKEAAISSKTSKRDATNLYSGKDQFPMVKHQLVPVKKHHDVPAFHQSSSREILSQVPNRWNCISNKKMGNCSVTELVATKKVSFYTEGNIQRQEEFQMKQTTVFRHPETGIPTYQVSEVNFHPDDMKELRRRFMSPQISNEPHENQISDVIKKFESL